MLPVVSVIIPCYNQGKFLAQTIESVLAQTYENIEVIVVNDGSTDSATNYLLEKSEWAKTQIFTIKNSGVSAARNFAVRKSSGKYILPLDGDDLIAPTYIEKAVAVLENQSDIKVVTCQVGYFGVKKGRFNLPDYSLEKLMGQNLLVVTSLFRKKDFDLTIGFNDNMKEGFEDWDFWLTFLGKNGKVYRLEEELFFYRIARSSRNSTINLKKQERLRRQIYDNHREIYSSHFLNPQECFEYLNILNSKEYRLGKLLLKPIRMIISLLN